MISKYPACQSPQCPNSILVSHSDVQSPGARQVPSGVHSLLKIHHFPHHSSISRSFSLIQNFFISLNTLNYFFSWMTFFCPGFSTNLRPDLFTLLFVYSRALTVIWLLFGLLSVLIEHNNYYLMSESAPTEWNINGMEFLLFVGQWNINMIISDLILYQLYIIFGVCCHVLIEFYTSPQIQEMHYIPSFLKKLKTKYSTYTHNL